jgi:mRNA interferase HicA
MKSSELHRLIRRNGWRFIKAEGSHYLYEKHGYFYPVPFHRAKEMGKGITQKIIREMKLKY